MARLAVKGLETKMMHGLRERAARTVISIERERRGILPEALGRLRPTGKTRGKRPLSSRIGNRDILALRTITEPGISFE
jgi:plasmid stability protein